MHPGMRCPDTRIGEYIFFTLTHGLGRGAFCQVLRYHHLLSVVPGRRYDDSCGSRNVLLFVQQVRLIAAVELQVKKKRI